MSITQFAGPGVLAPLHGLWRWLMPARMQGRPAHPGVNICAREIVLHAETKITCHMRGEIQNSSKLSARRPLRIVRILEADQAPANVGRMVISGRMADVCAELDRLAAGEAAVH